MIEQLYLGFKRRSAGESSRCEFFDLRIVEDLKHLDCMPRWVLRYLRTVEDQAKVEQGERKCLDLIARSWLRQFVEVRKLQESQDA